MTRIAPTGRSDEAARATRWGPASRHGAGYPWVSSALTVALEDGRIAVMPPPRRLSRSGHGSKDITRIRAHLRVCSPQGADVFKRHEPHQRGFGPVVAADAGRTDAVATGTTLRAALAALRRVHLARVVLAVPVAPPQS